MGKIKQYSIVIGIWALTGIGVYFYARHKFKADIPKTVTVQVPYEVPKYVVDTNGVTHAQFKAVALQRDLYKHQLDSVAGLLKIKNKDITSVTDIATNTGISIGGDTVVVHDTTYSFIKVDPYYTIIGNITPNNWGIDLSLKDTLHAITYTKSHWFSPDETYVDISNSNPYVNVVSGRSVQIEQRKPILTIGPYVGYEIFPKSHWSVGISIQHPFITIK